jgi:hypothetical protein
MTRVDAYAEAPGCEEGYLPTKVIPIENDEVILCKIRRNMTSAYTSHPIEIKTRAGIDRSTISKCEHVRWSVCSYEAAMNTALLFRCGPFCTQYLKWFPPWIVS